MYPFILNTKSILEINQSTHSVRTNCTNFLPSLRIKIYTSKGAQPKDYGNLKTYMLHKRGMMVIGINKWRRMPKALRHLRYIMRDIRWVALIHRINYKGVDPIVCMSELQKHNIDPIMIDAWTESDEILNNYSPSLIQLGLQSSGYILNLQGGFQTYNKVPGYVYPAEYMKPRPYITTGFSF